MYFQTSAIVVFREVSGLKQLLKMAMGGNSLHCTDGNTPGNLGLSGETVKKPFQLLFIRRDAMLVSLSFLFLPRTWSNAADIICFQCI